MKSFVHLHQHSEYSLLDGLTRVPDIVAKAKEFGMNAVALSDHGVMYGIYEFWKECKANEIKPILGVEAYVAARTRFEKVPKIDDKRFHILLLAKNFEGYRNLIKMVSRSHTEGFYYKPRIDRELIEQYGKGIIATTACMGGIVNKQLLNGQEKEAREWAHFLKSHFDDFFMEIQRNGMKKVETLVPKQIELAKSIKLPLVCTCDVHYKEKSDWYAQEVLWAISDGRKMDDDNRRKSESQEFYIKSQEEVNDLFKDFPEAIENTQYIADSIENFDIVFERIQPRYEKLPNGITAEQLLKEKTYTGAKRRYGKITKEIEDRLKLELGLIHTKGYDDYFLVVQDYVNWALGRGIVVGPGRGSGGGSVVAYSLNITNIDPFKFELYFERFLNPERPSPPDFDIDFQDDRRDELFEYMSKTYGENNTAFIGTFGRMKTRAAIRDVARVMDIDLEVADKLSKMVDVKFGKVAHMQDMIDTNDEFKNIIQSDSDLREMSEIVKKVEGIARHVSTHACGYLVTPDSIDNYIPLQKETRGGVRTISQIEGYSLEDIGLMKFDFLGLSNLTIIKHALTLISQNTGKNIELNDVSLEDKSTFGLFGKGETTAVFQFESDGMKKYLKELKPNEFEDIIFLCAAYRPGPMKYIPEYIARKYGKEKTVYLHEKLEPILKNTYGIAIYQEQVLRIAVDMAGYSLGEADVLRRAIGKKKPEVLAAEKEKFLKGCEKEGYSSKLAHQLFSYIEPFADYGFNRSHAAAYALISFWTAYLKTHFPVEFMAGLMQTDIDTSDKITRDILEAERMKIEVLPPHINKSNVEFTIEENKKIRFGLGAIKNVGTKTVEKIVKEREAKGHFGSMDELVERVRTFNLSKKDLECLIKAGAMDQFGSRNALLDIMPNIVEGAGKREKSKIGGQTGLFDTPKGETTIHVTPLPDVEEESERDKLLWEKELIGTYLTSHPLKKYQKYYGEEIMTVPDIKKAHNGKSIKLGGMITDKKVIQTKQGNKEMAFIRIECLEDSIEGVMFNGVYEKYKEKIELDKPFVFMGKVSHRDDRISVLIDELLSFSKFKPSMTNGEKKIRLDISDETDPIKLKILKQIIIDNPGDYKVTLYYKDQFGKKCQKELSRKVSLNETVKNVISGYLIRNVSPSGME